MFGTRRKTQQNTNLTAIHGKKYGHVPSEAQFLSYALPQIRVNVQKFHLEPQHRTLSDLLGNSRCRAYLQKSILYKLLLALLITGFNSKNSRL